MVIKDHKKEGKRVRKNSQIANKTKEKEMGNYQQQHCSMDRGRTEV